MPSLSIALLAGAGVGHVVFWVSVINRVHALGIPRWAIGLLSAACWGAMVVIPFVLLLLFPLALLGEVAPHQWPLWTYAAWCWAVGLVGLGQRVHRAIHRPHRAWVLLANHTRSIDLVDVLGHRPVRGGGRHLLSRLPLNQALHLRIHEKTIRVPRWPASLDGLRIAHLSDLHMFGGIRPSFFRQIVEHTLELEPDLIALTGDLFDKDECIDWVDETLARLAAPCGVYFVLGNHDLRVDAARARRKLQEARLVDLGGRWLEIEVRGEPLVLAGNELPWFGPAADMEHCPRNDEGPHVPRIVLAHTPDQIDWARRYDFDLMLAGHTHGGQVRVPLLGPIFSPSRTGTRYNAGTFYVEPTVLHVSRGISGVTPLRVNCPPELALLELRSGSR